VRVFFDTEFLDDGVRIDLISIGMVADDGRELYLVNADAPWGRIRRYQWLMDNVVAQLPHDNEDWHSRRRMVDFQDPCVVSKVTLADEVEAFIKATPKPELWAYYAAHDHVVLTQLFGPLGSSDRIPWYTNDLKQELVRLGNPRYPAQAKGQHHALEDARWNKLVYDYLLSVDDVTKSKRK